MSISNLSGFTWKANESIDIYSIGTHDYRLNFQSNGSSYTRFSPNVRSGPWSTSSLKYGSTTVYNENGSMSPEYNGWDEEAYKTIKITGGLDATNSSLINWLLENGELIPSNIGVIYWTTSDDEKTLYISSNEFIPIEGTPDIHLGAEWIQDNEYAVPPWFSKNPNITKAIIYEGNNLYPISLNDWFYDARKLVTIEHLEQINDQYVLNAHAMFVNCIKLDYSCLETQNEDFEFVFALKLPNCKTFKGMFAIDEEIEATQTSLNLVGLDFSSCVDCSSMFQRQDELITIYFDDNIDTSKVNTMAHMFTRCVSLTGISNIDKFNTNSVQDMKYMFCNCRSLTSLDISDWDVSNVEDMSFMFGTTSNSQVMSLTSLDLSNWDTSNVKTTEAMFSSCEHLTITGIENINVSNCENMRFMFNANKELGNSVGTIVDLSEWNTSKVRDMYCMFQNCTGLRKLDINGWDTSKVTNLSFMFYHDSFLTEILGIEKIDVSNVANLKGTFEQTGIYDANLSNWDTSNVEDMSYMFNKCYNVQQIDIGGFNVGKVKTTSRMFSECTSLSRLSASSNWDTANILDSSYMFYQCTSIYGYNGTTYDSTKIDKQMAVIDERDKPGYFFQSVKDVIVDVEGLGIVKGYKSYKHGAEVEIKAIPSESDHYYLESLYIEDIFGTRLLTNKHTKYAYTYRFIIKNDSTIHAVFRERPLSHLTVNVSEPDIFEPIGEGDYYYLDKVVVSVEGDSNKLINFLGWSNNGELISNKKDYEFEMPDSYLELDAITDGYVFDDKNVRQFALMNGRGQICKLTDLNSCVTLINPSGLGLKKSITSSRHGNAKRVEKETYDLPKVTGKLIFYGESNDDIYLSYNQFCDFILAKPIYLYQKIPTDDVEYNEYYIPAEVIELTKDERNEERVLPSEFEFEGTGFWKLSTSEYGEIAEDIVIDNSGKFEIGAEIVVSKNDESPFSNPVITFEQNGEIYGAIALKCDDITKFVLNTKDGNQRIELYNGNELFEDPFKYIDFDFPNGKKILFPYPKLKLGETTVKFTYKNDIGDNKNYQYSYDKEYISV